MKSLLFCLAVQNVLIMIIILMFKIEFRSEDESANEYETCTSPTEEIDSNSGWQEVIRYLFRLN